MRVLEYSVDINTGDLVDGTTGYALSEIPELYRGDGYMLRLTPVTVNRSTSPYTVTAAVPNPAYTYAFSAKKKGDYDNAEFLIYSDVVSIVSSKWEITFDTGGEDLLTAIGGVKETLRIKCDLQGVAVGLEPYSPVAFFADVVADVNRGDEGIPTEQAATYYTKAEADALFAPLAQISIPAGYRIVFGTDGSITVQEIT